MSLFFRYIVQFNIINVIFVKDSNQLYSLGGSWCQKFKRWLCAPGTRPFEPKINGLWHSVEEYLCAIVVIPIRDFRFIVLTYTSTHPRTHIIHRYKVIAISSPPYYVVGADDHPEQR